MRYSLAFTTFAFAFIVGFAPACAKPQQPPPPTTAPQAQVDYGAYMARLERSIKKSWHPPRGKSDLKSVVLFSVHRSGRISDVRIKKSSGDREFDRGALNTLEAMTTVEPLPQGTQFEKVDINFTFDYHANETTAASGAAAGAASGTGSGSGSGTRSEAASGNSPTAGADSSTPSKPMTPEDNVYALGGFGMLCAMVVIFFQTVMAIWVAAWLGIERLKLLWSQRRASSGAPD
jgi:TonB family protein